MKTRIMLKLSLFLLAGASMCLSENVKFEWNSLNFTWPSIEHYQKAIQDGSYQPINNIITGIKIWKENLYLTVPRWQSGVPATLTMISASPIAGDLSPLLCPYPSWSMQKLDDCRAFQYVQSMEIDPLGRMWVLDNGRTEFSTNKPRTKCPPRLVILDLNKRGQVILEHVFPEDVARSKAAFLNDIVLDHEDGGWAYITDVDEEFPGIIVFSLEKRISWKISHDYMKPLNEASTFSVNGTMFKLLAAIDGIALSPASTEGNRTLYFTPLSSFEVFAVPTWVLKTSPIPKSNECFRSLGQKSSQTDGMMITSKGTLYYGLLSENAVASWMLGREPLSKHQSILFQNGNTNQWPDTFAMDDAGQLWWTTNRIQKFQTSTVDLTQTNYRVLAMNVSDRSYQYYEDGRQPKMPDIY